MASRSSARCRSQGGKLIAHRSCGFLWSRAHFDLRLQEFPARLAVRRRRDLAEKTFECFAGDPHRRGVGEEILFLDAKSKSEALKRLRLAAQLGRPTGSRCFRSTAHLSATNIQEALTPEGRQTAVPSPAIPSKDKEGIKVPGPLKRAGHCATCWLFLSHRKLWPVLMTRPCLGTNRGASTNAGSVPLRACSTRLFADRPLTLRCQLSRPFPLPGVTLGKSIIKNCASA